MLVSDSWKARVDELNGLIVSQGVASYQTWPVIGASLFRGWTESEERERWEARNYFKTHYGTSPRIETGNAAQQAFALRLMDEHCMKLTQVRGVVELGAGLADMAKMAPTLMPNLEVYRIMDLPPMLRIQEHILGNSGEIYELWDTTAGLFDGLPRETVFVSICALSETPTLLRDGIAQAGGARKFVLRVQEFWDGAYLLPYFDAWEPTFRMESYFAGHWWLVR